MSPPPAAAVAVDLSVPADAELMAAATPDPRAEAARLTAGDPGQIHVAARRLIDAGPALDGAYEQSRRAQRLLAAGFANNGAPVYDEATHWSQLPAGFRDTGTTVHDAGRRLDAVADELSTATTEVTGRLRALGGDLNAWRAAWAAEVSAARGPDGLIPAEQVPRLQARRADVIAGMQEAVGACARTIVDRVARYNQVLADCARLLVDARLVLGGAALPGGATAPTGPDLWSGSPLLAGGQLAGSSLPAPVLPTPGFTPAPGGPSILIQPVPGPDLGLPGFTPAPPGSGPLINLPAPDRGPYRDTARGKDAPKPGGPPPPNLTPEGAGRPGAFGQAKRDSGIPVGLPPTRVLPNVDRDNNPVPGRIYFYEVPEPGGGTKTVWIRDDAGGHVYPDDPKQNRGPHFNTQDGGHYDY